MTRMESILLAHHAMLHDKFENSLPVFGSPAEALVIALLFTAVVLAAYIIVDRLPKPQKNRISSKNEPLFIKLVIGIMTLAIISVAWDVWWHRAIGRDIFFIAPHIFLYIFLIVAICMAFYVWRHCRDIVWKHIVFAMLFIPIAALFDNFFHTLSGVEYYSTARFIWSPGHVMIGLAGITTMGLLLAALVKYRRTTDFIFYGSLCLGAILDLSLFLLMPFHPTESWGRVAGFAGAGVLAMVVIAMCLFAERALRGRISAVFMTAVALVLMSIAYGHEAASHLTNVFDRPPFWLIIFCLLVPAVFLDLTKDRFPLWMRGFLAGIIWSAILFGFSSSFFTAEFQYGLPEIFMAITFSALGGLTVASFFSLLHLDDEAHIEKLLKKW
jgi:hypothetical protein